jgi:hypothetical protein
VRGRVSYPVHVVYSIYDCIDVMAERLR